MSEKVDLASMGDNEVSDLYWAVYDLNASTLKLINAGLVDAGGTVDINATMNLLEAELQFRRDGKREFSQRSPQWATKPS